jgi:gamma-glutamyltranspeptidase/glutathione hydrolase
VSGKPVAAYGTPGGRTIVNNQAYFSLGLFRWERPLEETLGLPRMHCEEWDRIDLETSVPDAVAEGLVALGHEIQRVEQSGGPAHGILMGPETGQLEGATDPRNEGKVAWE